MSDKYDDSYITNNMNSGNLQVYESIVPPENSAEISDSTVVDSTVVLDVPPSEPLLTIATVMEGCVFIFLS